MKVEELLLLPPTAVFTVVLPLTYKGLQSVTRDANCTLMLKSDFFEPLSLWFVLKPSTLVVHVKTGILLKLQACLGLTYMWQSTLDTADAFSSGGEPSS